MTTGEAQDLSPRYTIVEDLASIKDESTKRVSRALREQKHIPVKGNAGQAQATKQEVAEGEQEAEMVIKRKLTVNRFLSNSRPLAQPQ